MPPLLGDMGPPDGVVGAGFTETVGPRDRIAGWCMFGCACVNVSPQRTRRESCEVRVSGSASEVTGTASGCAMPPTAPVATGGAACGVLSTGMWGKKLEAPPSSVS